jgi:hypothetical protein
MKCKDCIHYEACLEFSKYIESARGVEDGCEHFSAKVALGTVSLNYEAEYHRAMDELSKANTKNEQLLKDLQIANAKIDFLQGIAQTVEIIHGQRDSYDWEVQS